MNPKYGGLDLAQRVDNSALVVLELDEGVLKLSLIHISEPTRPY